MQISPQETLIFSQRSSWRWELKGLSGLGLCSRWKIARTWCWDTAGTQMATQCHPWGHSRPTIPQLCSPTLEAAYDLLVGKGSLCMAALASGSYPLLPPLAIRASVAGDLCPAATPVLDTWSPSIPPTWCYFERYPATGSSSFCFSILQGVKELLYRTQ